MLKLDKLQLAVELQKKSYALLKWIDTMLKQGVIQAEAGQRYVSEEEATVAWLMRHYASLPQETRVDRDDPEKMLAFARMFNSFLVCSFDFREKAVTVWSYVRGATHMQVRQPTKEDNKRARRLKRNALEQIAVENGLSLTKKQLDAIMKAEKEIQADLAKLAYGRELTLRMLGSNCGPAALALWREFTQACWQTQKKPRWRSSRGYELTVDEVLHSEEVVTQFVKSLNKQ